MTRNEERQNDEIVRSRNLEIVVVDGAVGALSRIIGDTERTYWSLFKALLLRIARGSRRSQKFTSIYSISSSSTILPLTNLIFFSP